MTKAAISIYAPTLNKAYCWNPDRRNKWYNNESPADQGKRKGPLVCVYVDDRQSVYKNNTGLHIIANAHLDQGDFIPIVII